MVMPSSVTCSRGLRRATTAGASNPLFSTYSLKKILIGFCAISIAYDGAAPRFDVLAESLNEGTMQEIKLLAGVNRFKPEGEGKTHLLKFGEKLAFETLLQPG